MFHEEGGFRHGAVDDGEERVGKMKSTPIMVADGSFDAVTIAKQLAHESAEIDATIAGYVLGKVKQYGGRG